MNLAFRIILIIALAIVARVYLTQARTLLRDRLVALILWVALTMSIAYPPLTNIIAHRLGVSRGVDLAIYIAFLIVFFMTGRLNAQKRQLARSVTLLTRQLAIQNARRPDRPSP